MATLVIAAFGQLICGGAAAAALRISLATDAATMDPHALNAVSTTLVLRQIYEPLVGFGKDLQKEPALAISWSRPEATRWRFKLRPGVRFQDGSVFDADDVVFSLQRARTGFSDFRIYTSDIVAVHKIDSLTVDIVTAGPDPILPEKLSRVFIMDSEWAHRHNAENPQNFATREASYAALHANGTGPYRLVQREPDGRTELEKNAGWWGRNESGVDSASFRPITSAGPRVAALLSGDVDLVLDVPPELVDKVRGDRRFRVAEQTESRSIFLGMDQASADLLYSDVKGRNPFKDLRVRQAIYMAIDAEAIRSRLMLGHSRPTALLWAPSVFGYSTDDDKRPPVDPARARQLLAEAGYPSGFDITLDCPANRNVNDGQICQAVASQLARIGIRVKVNLMPFGLYVGKLRRMDSSFYLFGWSTPTFDPLITLQAVLQTRDGAAAGNFNFGRYSNPKLDSLIDRLRYEADRGERLRLIREAARLARDDVAYIPIHDQTLVWAMRKDIDTVLPPENQLELKWITLGGSRE